MIKVVLDSNIYLSALIFGGKPKKILRLGKKRKIEISVSEGIIEEVSRVLKKKFNWSDVRIRTALKRIRRSTDVVFPKNNIGIIKAKESDNHILECTVEGRADYIVSGDKKHILPLKEFKGIKIVNPDEFLKIFDKGHKLS